MSGRRVEWGVRVSGGVGSEWVEWGVSGRVEWGVSGGMGREWDEGGVGSEWWGGE